jgi:hypothetical protein
MAALAAVDAKVHGRRVPADMAGLTAYLLNREHENWQQLHENQAAGLNYRTPAEMMARTVFTATLTGATSRQVGLRLLADLDVGLPAEVTNSDVLADHAKCYPPTVPSQTDVLQPLQPDRLAEDFIALTLDGSPISGYPVDPWATTATRRLLETGSGKAGPMWNRRALTILAAAAERWTHVGERHLYPVLEVSPQIAVNAGSGPLTAIAAVNDIPSRILAAIKQALPHGRSFDVDSGAAALTDRLTRRMPMVTEDMPARARYCQDYACRLAAAGRPGEAVRYAEQAVVTWRIAKEFTRGPASGYIAREMAEALHVYAGALCGVRQWPAMLDATREAMEILKELPTPDPSRHLPALAAVMTNHAIALSGLGRLDEALDCSGQAVATFYMLVVKEGHHECVSSLARAAHNHADRLVEAGRHGEALRHLQFAIKLREELIKFDRAVNLADLAASALAHAQMAADAGQLEAGLASGHRAVELLEEMAAADRSIYLPWLVQAVTSYSIALGMAGRKAQAEDYAHRGIKLGEELLASRPSGNCIAELADHMSHLALWWEQAGRQPEALDYSRRAVEFCEHLASHTTDYQPGLTFHLRIFASIRARLGVDLDAANRAADRAANVLADEAAYIPAPLRNEVSSGFREMFTLLGRVDDAAKISRQLLDKSDAEHAAAREAREKEQSAKWAQDNPDWKNKVGDELRYILAGNWRHWPNGQDPPNRS